MERDFDYVRWNGIKNKLKLKYPMLTKSDLIWRHGTKNDLLEMIAHKLGKSPQELKAEVDKF